MKFKSSRQEVAAKIDVLQILFPYVVYLLLQSKTLKKLLKELIFLGNLKAYSKSLVKADLLQRYY